ncbi:Plasmodium variant antigen protein Cir/Yir/Bir, putative [Plasmodium chabaudi chabaudi]|uniref:Plasmodium variant antigen protein Cir/Yir/Bir, putative n=1 Tax=Plasmodium chabaudi chabaudi TaxID=31271 RepID=A0A1C6W9Y7_PLACU|nr:Plasmodium variant antigen protein Cir/Yir/Bir, putative [Plasmodium chabaudi chabaudi]
MTLNLCNAFNGIEEFLPNSLSLRSDDPKYNLYKTYCPTDKTGKPECRTDGERIGAMFKYLLGLLFDNNEDDLESENKKNEYTDYAILWLSNKIRHFKYQNNMHVMDFYVTFIKNGDWYKDVRDKINGKNKIMKIKVSEMYNLYDLLNILCKIITNYSENPSSCPECSNFTNKWGELSQKLVNKETKFFEDEHYCNALLTLKNAYEKFKNDNNNPSEFPNLREIKGINDCKKLCEGANSSWKVIHVEVKDAVTKENVNEGKQSSGKKTEEPIPVGTTELNIALPNTADVPINDIIEIKVVLVRWMEKKVDEKKKHEKSYKFGCWNKSTKGVINSFDDKRQMEVIINSVKKKAINQL